MYVENNDIDIQRCDTDIDSTAMLYRHRDYSDIDTGRRLV